MERIKSSPCRSRAEKTLICNTLFDKVPDIKGLRPYTETQKSHRQGGAIVRPCLFRKTHKGFQRIDSSTNKGKRNELSAIHFCLFFFKGGFTFYEVTKINF